MSSSCLASTVVAIVVVVAAALLHWAPATGVQAAPPNLLHCIGSNFQLLYELNSYTDDYVRTPTSYLVLEAASTRSHSGRLLIHARPNRAADTLHYWSTNATHLQTLELRPFICNSFEQPLNSNCKAPEILDHLLPKELASLFCYSNGQVRVRGPLAILANLQDPNQFEPKGDRPKRFWKRSRPDLQFQLDWKEDVQDECAQLHTLQLKLIIKGIVNFIMTILEVELQPSESSMRPPLGYACPADIGRPLPREPQLSNPPDSLYARHIKVRVGISRGTRGEPHRLSNWPQDSLRPLKPLDSVEGQQHLASLKTFSLIVDPNQLLVSYQDSDQLTVWDISSRHKFIVSNGGTQCDHQTIQIDRTSLFGIDKLDSCEHESIKLDLGDDTYLLLNDVAVDLLTGRLQFESKDVVYSSNGELIHETILGEMGLSNQLLCLQRTREKGNLKNLSLSTASLIRRYIIQEDGSYKPHTSTLLVFDNSLGDRDRLDLQISIEILVHEVYQTWKQTNNPIDLSACAPVANLVIEYQLDKGQMSYIKRSTSGLRERIRYAVAGYLYLSHKVHIIRVPSIDILPLDEKDSFMTISMRLLDRIVPFRESSRQRQFSGNLKLYKDLLESSQLHVMADSIQVCEELCNRNRCRQYIFCKYMLACYIYTVPGVDLYSFVNVEFHCEAFVLDLSPVDQTQMENHGPRLSKLLDDIVNAIEEGAGPKISLIAPVGPKSKPCYSQVITLTPSNSRYSHEHQPELKLYNFDILINGHKLETTETGLRPRSDIHHSLAASSDGYLKFEDETDPSDCALLCQLDLTCNAFSHCPGRGECLITSLHEHAQEFGPRLKPVPDRDCSVLVREHETKYELVGEQLIHDGRLDSAARIYQVDNIVGCEVKCRQKDGHYFDLCLAPDLLKYCIIYTSFRDDDDKELVDAGIIDARTVCKRYARNHLEEYTALARKALTSLASSPIKLVENFVTVASLSMVECSKLCDQDDQCGAFEWCSDRKFEASTISCRLGNILTLTMTSSELIANSASSQDKLLVPQSNCTVFTRKGLKLTMQSESRINRDQRPVENDDKAKPNYLIRLLETLRFDLILFGVSVAFAFLVKDFPIAGHTLSFRRFNDSVRFSSIQDHINLRLINRHPSSSE